MNRDFEITGLADVGHEWYDLAPDRANDFRDYTVADAIARNHGRRFAAAVDLERGPQASSVLV